MTIGKAANTANILRRYTRYLDSGAILYRWTCMIEEPAEWEIDGSSDGKERCRERRLRRGRRRGGWFWQARRDRIGHGRRSSIKSLSDNAVELGR